MFKVYNRTKYGTAIIKKIFKKCLQEIRKTENFDQDKLVVEVGYARSPYWVAGFASYGLVLSEYGKCYRVKMKLVKDGLPEKKDKFIRDIATIFIHEIGHCMGIHHHKGRTIEHLYREWIMENFDYERFTLNWGKNG